MVVILYKDIKKNDFVNKYKCLNMIKKHQNFLKIIKDLKPYFIKFKEDKFIKTKNYSKNYLVDRNIR